MDVVTVTHFIRAVTPLLQVVAWAAVLVLVLGIAVRTLRALAED